MLSIVLASLLSAGDLPEPSWTDAQRDHWAFVPPRRPDVPATRRPGRARNPIDAFVLAELEALGLEPAEEASRATLIRRLRFDLTGLPPSPEEVDQFLGDDRPDAYERLVDRLLASPEYGERWGRPWLDLARFAESDGFKSDKTRPDAWRYRDWVVSALNADMPYDRFVALQVAGDELEPDDASAFIATGFNRAYPYEDNNMVPGLNRQVMLDDVTDTTASVFLGLTVACARCHDHKFDPISQVDYYRLQALFAAVEPKDDRPLADPFSAAVHAFVEGAHGEDVARARRAVEEVERPYVAALLKDKLATLPADLRVAFETEPLKRSAFQEDLLARNAKKMAVDAKKLKASMPDAERRLWEARTGAREAVAKRAPRDIPRAIGMTDSGPDAPTVFLLRKGAFGQPVGPVDPGFPSVLSASTIDHRPSTIATTGRRAALASWIARPDNPLTARVMINRLWQGHFGRGIVATPSDFGTQGARPSNPALLDWLASEFVHRGWSLKAMHRLMVTSSTYRRSSTPPAQAIEDDPDNTFLGRMPRRRLEAEAVRDALLAVSGRLDRRVGGPSVFPDLPPGVETRGGWERSKDGRDRDRRSLYVFARRNLKYPLFDAFDAPDPNLTCPERNESVNAPQALMLLNSDLVLDLAVTLAERARREAGRDDSSGRVDRVFFLALGRAPDAREADRAARFLASGGSLADLAHAVVNSNEFVFVD